MQITNKYAEQGRTSWNHSMGQSGLSQPIMSPYDAWKAGQHLRL